MFLEGKLIAETPIYRGNARKTLFTRDGDGTERLVSLAGEIEGTAQSLMDAFIGQSRRGDNIGLLNELWRRLYDSQLPNGLITRVKCNLQDDFYPQDHFFGLRMGIKLDEDRWAAEANANYKMETIFRNAAFDFKIWVDDDVMQKGNNSTRLYYLLQELREGRFWFGAGKSKGLGRVRLEMEMPSAPEPPQIRADVNHLQIILTFDALNPVLVGWNWGKVEPGMPAFVAVEGKLLVDAMRGLPDPIRERLGMVIGGPILSPEDWKQKLIEHLPRVIAIWLQERSTGERDVWILSNEALKKLGKGRYKLAKSAVEAVKPLCEKPFSSKEAAEKAFVEALEDKAHMADRILDAMEQEHRVMEDFDREAWLEVAEGLGLDPALEKYLAPNINDEGILTNILTDVCVTSSSRLYQLVDHQIRLLQSDAWVDDELASRREHLKIKQMLLDNRIGERQWGDPSRPPEGVSSAAWRSFLDDHRRVKFRYMTNSRNLRKSVTNDRNFIDFLESYRDRTRQELAQPQNIDFRTGGPSRREVSRKHGKPYDTVFMRMLSWSPSSDASSWEIYIPGSTIKGAFRKRASQVLKTLWGETRKTHAVLDYLFGKQGQRGAVFFSDAYLVDPLDPKRAWCSMDGVKMNSRTGKPIEEAKRDYLFAYGEHLAFRLQLDIQDIGEREMEALSVLIHLLGDFQRGDIPIGGEKTSGFGWVEADVAEVTWLTAEPATVTQALFAEHDLEQDGIWKRLTLEGGAADEALDAIAPMKVQQSIHVPPKASAGFISHRSFGGHCGELFVEAKALSPIHVKESGEPSYKAKMEDGSPINGWDFFSMAPPEAEMRPDGKTYALPSQSIKGLLRHTYAIVSNSVEPSSDLAHMNPVDSLFGWVGPGRDQAIMGRLSVGFGMFDEPELAWFEVPYPYTGWMYTGGEWVYREGQTIPEVTIAQQWRLFPHTPMAPIVKQLDNFQPSDAQANYCHAIMPGSRARFAVRFWNLEDEELQRLIWAVNLEPGLAHKMGGNRYLGFGSLRMRLLPESYLIDWSKRYATKTEEEWQMALQVDEWLNRDVVAHYDQLQKILNAEQV